MTNINAEYAGSAASVVWTYSAATLDLSAHTRNITITPSMDVIDATAGQDQSRQFLPSFVGYEYSWEGLAQGTAGTVGVNMSTALAAGVTGTITVGPFGATAGYLRYQMPAFSRGLVHTMPYADVSTLSCTFATASGGTATVGTF